MENNRKEIRPAAISIGKRLKEAREKKSLTIEQIQKQTKIHSSVLIALEEGRASDLLTDTYIKSFLKKYASLLGMQTGEIIKEYFPPHQEPAVLNIPTNENSLPEETKKGPEFLYFTGIAILGIASLLLLFVIIGKTVSYFNKTALTNRQKQMVSNAAIAKKKSSKSMKSTQTKKPQVKTNTASKDIIPKSTPLSLVIKVKEPVLVKLTKDGVLIFARVMSKNLVETITANESIELEIGKAQALELTLNDRYIVLPTKKNVFGLIITRKGVRLK